jgi:RimJ/RimL family protein N-acetyltransferase
MAGRDRTPTVTLTGTTEGGETVFAHPLGDGAELGMLEPWHAEEFLDAVRRSREHLLPAIPVAHTVHTVEDARAYLRRFADGHAKDAEHLFGIRLDGALVGVTMLFTFDTLRGTCEMGVWLAPEARGRGLVTRACRYVLDWAFETRGMKRVQWTHSPDNDRSAATARRLGMTREGVLRSAWTLGGVRTDSVVWSVLAEEWPTKEITSVREI